MSAAAVAARPASPGLAADPALPHRDRLLDASEAGARLRAALARAGAPDAGPGCVLLRTKYRIGESLRVTLRLGGRRDGELAGDRLVSARMFPPEQAAAQAERALAAAARAGAPADAVVVDEELGTVFWTFPHDRKLEGASSLLSPPPSACDAFGARWAGSELVAYSPEKAATARCLDAHGGTLGYGKVALGHAGARSLATLHAARRLSAPGDALTLPVPVTYLPEHHLALCTAAPGEPLHALPTEQLPPAMDRLGRALGQLHRAPAAGCPPFTRLEIGRVRRAGELVATARPDLADLTGRLVARLAASAPVARPAVLLHGDLHPKNVLVHGTGISLVDLDQAAAGPPAAELGGLLARLWCPRPADGIEPGVGEAAAAAVLASYPRRLDDHDLRWYAAAALLVERGGRAVNRVHVDTLIDLERVLTLADTWVPTRAGRRP
jgi:aminoglycoside phosphotransferase